MSWTALRIESLRQGWVSGMSANQIADAIGVTRNAVIGKLTRIGLLGTREKDAKARLERALKKNRASVAQKINRPRRRAPRPVKNRTRLRPIVPRELPAEAIPFAQRRSLVELKNCHCRWPYGDPCSGDFFFCGAPEADLDGGHPYCQFHAVRAFTECVLPQNR